MAEGDIIRVKDLPYITNPEELNSGDRYVVTRGLPNGNRQTVAIPYNTLMAALTNFAIANNPYRKIIFGTTNPEASVGYEGDLYIKLLETENRPSSMYVKHGGTWIEFKFRRR